MNFLFKLPYYLLHRNPFFGFIFKKFIKKFNYRFNKTLLTFEVPFEHLSLSWLPGFLFKTYEMNDVSLIKKHLLKNEKVLNIGGGIGFIATLIYKITEEKVTIVEVDERILNFLKNNLRRNQVKYEIIEKPLALSNEISFSINNKKNYISNTTFPIKSLDSQKANTKVVDSSFFNNFDVLVIDAEGYEEYLLSNLSVINFDKIIIEFHPNNYLKLTSKDIENLLKKENYKEVDSFFQSKVFKKLT